MNIVGSVFIRLVQVVGLALVGVGIANLPALTSEIGAAWNNQNWSIQAIAPRLAAVTGPLLLGILIVHGLQASLVSAGKISQRRMQFPNEPWLWRDDWANRHIRLSNRPLIIIACYCWSFVVLLVIPLAVTLATVKNEKGLTTFLWFFVGMIVLVLWGFTNQIRVNWRWSRSELKLASLPGVIGGPIAGVILLNDILPEGTAFRVSLVCERTIRRRRSRQSDSTQQTDIVWQAQRVFNRTVNVDDPGITGLPFQFAIDYDCRSTSDADLSQKNQIRTRHGNETIQWFITVAVKDDPKLRGVKFEVPVYRTNESTPGYQLDESATEPYLEKPDPRQILQRGYFVEETEGDRVKFAFGLFSWSLLFGLLAGMAFFGLITAAILYWVAAPPKYFAALIPGILTILIAYGVLEAFCWRCDLTIDPEQIEIQSGWRGFRRKAIFERMPPPQLMTEVQFKKKDGAWWHLYVTTPSSAKLQVIQRLDGEQEANAVHDWLNQQWITGESTSSRSGGR